MVQLGSVLVVFLVTWTGPANTTLAINCYFKSGDLFLTITANPTLLEIHDELEPGQSAADQPDVVVCAFYAKQKNIIHDINSGIFGKAVGYVFTIKFQKHGLPYMDCIIFLDPESKLCTSEQIDSLLSSEFPEIILRCSSWSRSLWSISSVVLRTQQLPA